MSEFCKCIAPEDSVFGGFYIRDSDRAVMCNLCRLPRPPRERPVQSQEENARTMLEAWQEVFGTKQLSHAKARLDAAEAEVQRLQLRLDVALQVVEAADQYEKAGCESWHRLERNLIQARGMGLLSRYPP